MKNDKMSILDAFIALKDLDEVNEGQVYDLRDSKDMNAARAFIDEDATKEVALEVIDVNADTIEHLKDNKEYVGQFLLQCASCSDVKFVDKVDLNEAEGNSELYNIYDECPHCHAIGTGYTLLGQVGRVPEQTTVQEPEQAVEPEEEIKFENDQKSEEEATLSSEEETVESEEDTTESTEESEEEQVESTEEEEELSYDETDTTEEDEEESTLGDVVDEDDVPYDDTEEQPEETEEEKEEDKPKRKRISDELEESLETTNEEELVEEVLTVAFIDVEDFLRHKFLSPENLKSIKVLDYDNSNILFSGKFEDIPYDILKSFVYNFSTENGPLVIETCEDETSDDSVRDLLSDYLDTNNDNIHLCDSESSDTFYAGTSDDVCSEFGQLKVVKLENPESLVLIIKNDNNVEAKEEEIKTEEDKLIDNIVDANGLSKYKIDRPSTEENFVKECIYESEDLNLVYEKFVLPTQNKELIESFKSITGYRDALDIILENKNVYKGNIKVLTEEVKEEKTEKIFESVKNRKELSERLLDLKNNNKPYRVRKSVNEGYRYDIILLENESTAVIVPEEEPEVVDVEVVDAPEVEIPETTEVSTDNPADREIVDKLIRISRDIKNAIETNYNIVVDERAVLADLIQDLRLVSGQIKPEELENTPINELTKQMYNAYNGFNDSMKQLTSFETGEPITHSDVRSLMMAVRSLDGPQFSTKAIFDRIGSTKFLQAARAGQVPYFDRLQLDHVMREHFDTPEVTTETALSWLSEHSQAWEDFLTFFNLEGDGDEQNIPLADIEGWISEHDLLAADYQDRFNVNLFESKDKEVEIDDEIEISEDELRTIPEIIDDLVDEEKEAIDSYSKAEKEIQLNKDLEETEKDEILATIEHIKGEEQEHIEELVDVITKEEADEESETDVAEEETIQEDTHAKYAKPEGDKVASYNNALTYAKKENKPFIYGYTNHTGKFFALDQPIKISGDVVESERAFRDQYKNSNVVYIVYPDKSFITESDEDFDEISFDQSVNRFFLENYEDILLYRTTDGYIDENDNIVVEGIIDSEDYGSDHNITFKLTEEDNKYRVSNSLSDETFLIEKALVKQTLNERSYSASGSGTVYIIPKFEVEFEGFKIKGSVDASAYVRASGSGYYEPATYWEPADGEFEVHDFEVEEVECESINSIDEVLDSEGNTVTDENFKHEKYETLDDMLDSDEFFDAVYDAVIDLDVSEYIDKDDLDFDWDESEPDYDYEPDYD